MDEKHLITYLNDHLAGSVLAIEMLESSLEGDEENPSDGLLARLLDELREDQAALKALIEQLGGKENPAKKMSGWLAEKASRVKLSGDGNGMAQFETLELLLVGIRGKLALWGALEEISDADQRLHEAEFRALQQRAQRQMELVEKERLRAARRAFIGG